ncbi:MAG: ATP-binding protein, partial [Ignavibacteria bacterium]|nr:ATP-binding protein [Ignavibacteria bacterium]
MVEHNTKLLEKLNQERELYADLANVLPAGMYRTRVFANVSIIGENWSSSQNTPYLIEYANARFYEILQLERDVFIKNPGIINDLIFEDDKAEFAKMNVEANLKVTPFTWEGRFNIKDTIIWIHFESIPRCMENGDIIWTGVLYDISKRKQTELDIAAKNRELEQLNADKAMISTVFRNLISNALKFTMPGGKVLISAIKDNDEIIFSVQDTGIGISGNRVEKLFNIDRAKTTLGTNNEEGTGLGLILCKEFVEIHGGKIRVESEDG